jgi:predicted AlkP superfamily pyrophosphatase or phosphodiesterase
MAVLIIGASAVLIAAPGFTLLGLGMGGYHPAEFTYLPGAVAAEVGEHPLHVFYLGVDGWGEASEEEAEMPTVDALSANGVSAVHARNVLPAKSAPNWEAMITGSGPDLTGWYGNTWVPRGRVVYRDEFGYFPNLFAALRKARPEAQIGVFYEWSPLPRLYPRTVANENERVKHLSVPGSSDIDQIIDWIGEVAASEVSLTFVAFNGPDEEAHAHGFRSRQYYESLKHVDSLVGRLVEAVRAAGILEQSVFVLTADHGGTWIDHGILNTERERRIPVIFNGKNVTRGKRLWDVSICDIAPTVLAMFGVAAPRVWVGHTLDL